jgi:ABC-2 type transport system permease protein
MNKTVLVASNVFKRRVRSKGFLFLTFAFPLILVAVGMVSIFAFRETERVGSVGWVDETGRLADPAEGTPGEEALPILPFNDVQSAHSAYENGQIESFIVIPSGYFEGEQVVFYGESPPGGGLQAQLAHRLRQAIQPDVPAQVLDRLTEAPQVTYIGLEQDTEISSGVALGIYFFSPAVLAFVFALAVLFTTGQMGEAIVREKESRAMEIVITSLRPADLVAGKVMGFAGLALTQFGIWILSALAAAILFLDLDIPWGELVFPWQALLWGLFLVIPAYLLYALLGAGAGIITGNHQQAEGVAGVIGFIGFVPFWLAGYFIGQPDSPVAVALTLFPLTAPTVALLRMAFTEVPTWQLAASFSLLVLSLFLTIWFIARVFRTTMLMYGQAARPTQIWRAIRGA